MKKCNSNVVLLIGLSRMLYDPQVSLYIVSPKIAGQLRMPNPCVHKNTKSNWLNDFTTSTHSLSDSFI